MGDGLGRSDLTLCSRPAFPLPISQGSVHDCQPGRILLVGGEERPPDLRQVRAVGIDQVAALPSGLELLLELEERLALFDIAVPLCQEVNDVVDPCLILLVNIAHRGQTKADHLGSCTLQIVDGAGE